MLLVALTREVPSTIAACELTHIERRPIDLAAARAQHAAYEAALEAAGCTLRRLPPLDAMPDSVFVEDAAVVTDELAVIARPGAASRRGETASVAEALRAYRDVVEIEEPGTLDGGDVLLVGENVFVGLSSRTNAEGARQLAGFLEAYGYNVRTVEVRGALHLKSAATRAARDTVLLNPQWIDRALFDCDVIEVDPSEPFAANVLLVGDTLLCSNAFPRTNARLGARGQGAGGGGQVMVDAAARVPDLGSGGASVKTTSAPRPLRPAPLVVEIDASELAKAEGALTCCSIVFTV